MGQAADLDSAVAGLGRNRMVYMRYYSLAFSATLRVAI